MNTTQRIARNTAILTVAEVVTAVINLFFTMYVARYLGAEGFGVLSTALAFTALFGVFTDVGLNTLATREVARNKAMAPKYLGNIASMKIILNVLTLILVGSTINLIDYPTETKIVVYFIALYLIIDAFNQMFYSIFRAYEKMEFVTLGRVLNAILMLSGALFAVSRGFSITAFALTYAAASASTFILNFGVSTTSFTRFKVEHDFAFWRAAIREAWPFGLVAIFAGIYFWISSVMLSLIQGDKAVGWFNTAFRLVFSLAIIPNIYFSAAFPVMSQFYLSSKDSLRFLFERSTRYMFILAVPIAIGTSILAPRAINLIFGAEYSNSVGVLQVLVWAVAIVFVTTGYIQLFASVNKQIIVTIMTGICAVVNVVLNLILIPKYSYIGASIATLATELTSIIIAIYFSSKIGQGLSGKAIISIFLKALGASTVMGLFVFWQKNLNLWLLIPSSALLYFTVLFIIRGIDAEDYGLLKQVFHRQPAQANTTGTGSFE